MKVYKHKSHNAYQLRKKLVLIKNHQKIKFWNKGKVLPNFRFNIKPHKQLKYFHWLIQMPFLYFERNNGGLKIGLPNLYLWIIK
ncbi:hypothetical protein AXJ14_gp117 [Geobacillus virus E3]|uniref:hypothetical protein n=1 Tax=Geobacillus virus E3 TaxID=1572712 RepID=UPI000671CE02|nr:hypothetical protein AXJ14_gp117 [Geobacillus virus E3]AJA41436.1 hypothetical protein E3_0117 [Geobacillus virus E3]